MVDPSWLVVNGKSKRKPNPHVCVLFKIGVCQNAGFPTLVSLQNNPIPKRAVSIWFLVKTPGGPLFGDSSLSWLLFFFFFFFSAGTFGMDSNANQKEHQHFGWSNLEQKHTQECLPEPRAQGLVSLGKQKAAGVLGNRGMCEDSPPK